MTSADHWTQIKAALGDEKPGYTYLDDPRECWFAVQGRGLCAWQRGQLFRERAASPASVPLARHVFHHLDEECLVELTEHTEGGRIVFAIDNGAMFQAELDPSGFGALAEHYEELGFRRVNPWNLAADTVLWREYRQPGGDAKSKVVVSVDGTGWGAETWQECATRAEAEAAAEAHVLSLLAEGYRLVRMEQWEANEENPSVASAPAVPQLATYPEPESARAAVDQAVARLSELHRVLPKAHLVVELIELPEDRARLAALGHEHFSEWYPERLGRWLEPREAADAQSSFDYFVQRYGTLTWVVRPGSPDELGTFYCGNVCGGGTSPLEIHPHDYDCLEELAEANDEPGYLQLNVFHGGWHDGLSYALDTRFRSDEGEHPLIPFDECEPELPEGPPAEIQPFGYWLLERVKELSAVALPWLSKFQ